MWFFEHLVHSDPAELKIRPTFRYYCLIWQAGPSQGMQTMPQTRVKPMTPKMYELNAKNKLKIEKSPASRHKSWVLWSYMDCLQLHHAGGHADHIACKLTNRWKFACPAHRNACVNGCVTAKTASRSAEECLRSSHHHLPLMLLHDLREEMGGLTV